MELVCKSFKKKKRKKSADREWMTDPLPPPILNAWKWGKSQHAVSVFFHATSQKPISYWRVNMKSLTCTKMLVPAVHMEARQALTSLHRCSLRRTEKQFFTLSRLGVKPMVAVFFLHHNVNTMVSRYWLYSMLTTMPLWQGQKTTHMRAFCNFFPSCTIFTSLPPHPEVTLCSWQGVKI